MAIEYCVDCGKVEAGPGCGDGYGHRCAACERRRDERIEGESLEMAEEETAY